MTSAKAERAWLQRCAIIGVTVIGCPILAIWLSVAFYFDWTSNLAMGVAIVGSFTIGLWSGAAWAQRHPRP
jgi:hypothetical protein